MAVSWESPRQELPQRLAGEALEGLPSRLGNRVSVYSGRIAENKELPEYDRSAILAGATDALVTAPGVAVASASSRRAGGLGFTDEPRLGGAEEATFAFSRNEDSRVLSSKEELEEEEVEEEIEDNNIVFLTDSYKDWECHYLRRMAKRIHRLVCAQLDHRWEEALFMFFIDHDKDMDGVISGSEATKMIQLIEEAAPGSTSQKDELLASDGSISFVALLNWYNGATGGENRDTSVGFNVTCLTVGLLGSGMVHSDARPEQMGWAALRRNVLGYRRLLEQLRALQQERALRPARELESREGLLAAMPKYYELLSREFEGDDEHLFEIFTEADATGNMALEIEEVEALMLRLDKNATEEDLQRYVSEINMNDGPLSFASFLDWWDQARSVSNSLVAEKGAGLIAGVRAEALKEKVGNLFFETTVQKQWSRANQANRLPALRQAYCRTLSEVRDYKIQHSLRTVEVESAGL